MYVVGLTGGIGSGKSSVGDIFSTFGVPVLDADQVSRDITQPDSLALTEIRQRFGDQSIKTAGELDRAYLRQIIFDDPQAKTELEQILHPKIRQAMWQWAEQQTTPYCILAIPLLIETGQHQRVNRVLVVDAPETLQIERVRRRDNNSIESARTIIQSQIPRQERLDIADDTIDNSGTLEHLTQQVTKLHQKYLKLSTPLTG